MPEVAPLIVTARLDPDVQEMLDGLRREHFPAERNHLAAHLTLFHHLDGEGESEVGELLAREARDLPLAGVLGAPFGLGRGVAFAVECPELVALRGRLMAQAPGPLTDQDRGWGRPHVTVQNKVAPAQARALRDRLRETHPSRPLQVVALELWRYLGPEWEPLGSWGPADGHGDHRSPTPAAG